MAISDSDFDALLDLQLDDLKDLPEFKVYPAGTHIVTIEFDRKVINEHPAIELKMKAVETEELANAADTPLATGDECNVAFMLDNEFGQGKLKEVMMPLSAAFGTESIGATMAAAKGATCRITTKLRTDKNDKDKKYLDLKSIEVC